LVAGKHHARSAIAIQRDEGGMIHQVEVLGGQARKRVFRADG
jgi:hypothetical protein